MRSLGALVLALAAALLVAVSPATAQSDLSYNVPDLTTPGVSSSLLGLGRPATSATPSRSTRKPRRAPRATAKQLRALRFTPTAARTRRIDAQLATAAKATTPVPWHAEVDRFVTEGVYRNGVRQLVRTLGGSTRNVSDHLAATLVLGWVTHEQDRRRRGDGPTLLRLTDAQVRGGRAFLRQARHALARQPRVRRLSDARKQELAEGPALSVMHVNTVVRSLVDIEQRTDAARLQDALNAAFERTFGVRLRRITLTAKGFSR